MTKTELLKIFNSHGALLTGHFLLSSGLHSDKYIQCALVLQYPDIAEKLAKELVKKLNRITCLPLSTHRSMPTTELRQVGASSAKSSDRLNISVVVSPALGGIIIGQEVARVIGCRAIFTERDGKEEKMKLRRGFEIKPGENCLIVEDVITTGGSTKEVIDVVKNSAGRIVGIASIIDRTIEEPMFGFPYISLLKLKIKTYKPTNCRLCFNEIPLTKPGSRKKYRI
ncbi:MAG: orotate phosphoribosyltransferase [Elusimicrobiota bacterium]|nr:orotate phosphoribosyltransferase [Elusimicrobiota bacterium]